jgi:hypothetical protein
MAEKISAQMAGVLDGAEQSLGNGNMTLRSDPHSFTSTGTSHLTTDTLVLGRRRKGERPIGVILATSANLSAASLAIGITGTTGKYKAAAALPNATAAFVPFISSALDNDPLAAAEELIGTISGADIPAGVLHVEIIYAAR